MKGTRAGVAAVATSACIAASGCGLGKNRMLMVTRTNIGLAAETTPQPNAEISVSRTEALIAPVFGRGVTPASIAGVSVASNSGFLQSGIGSAFAVGDAAMTLTDIGAAADARIDSTLYEVRLHDDNAQPPGWVEPMLKPRAVYFATDTTFGFKAVWGGTAGYYPDRVVLGYNRKEGTLAPLQAERDQGNKGMYTVHAPSLIATVTVGANAAATKAGGPPTNAQFKHQQFFATGDAATRLGKLREVRESVFRQIDPLLADAIAVTSTEAKIIADHLYADPAMRAERETTLRAWLAEQGSSLTITQLLSLETDEAIRLRREYVKNLVPAPVEFSREVSELRDQLTVPGRSDERKELIRTIIAEELDAARASDASVREWPDIRDADGATEPERAALRRAIDRVTALDPDPAEPV
jgi:hypothetical protein